MCKKEIPRNSELRHTIAQITHLTAHNEFWEIMSKKEINRDSKYIEEYRSFHHIKT